MKAIRTLLVSLFALLCLGSLSVAQDGERVAGYPVGTMASGFVLRSGGLDPLRVRGTVQARNNVTQQVKIAGYWLPVTQVWRPINPAEVTSGPGDREPNMPIGTPLWAVLLEAPQTGAGYAGEVTLGSYGGHRWTGKGRLVVCVWADPGKTTPVPNCDVSGRAYRRVHVENVALR